ncbi:hypothetical protein [Azospirillum melinis]
MPTTRSGGRPDACCSPHHHVERVGDDDDEGVRGVLADGLADGLADAAVDADQVVAAHARLARDAGGDDHDVGTLDDRVVVAAGQAGVEALDRGGFGEIQRLAGRHAFGDVEQDDVAQFLLSGEQSQRAANLAGTDERNLLASHGAFPKTFERPPFSGRLEPLVILTS